MCKEVKHVQSSLSLQWLYRQEALFLQQEYTSSHSSFRLSSSHLSLWGRKLHLEAMTNSGACVSLTLHACSHWGHLIWLTSTGAPCTECATQNLGESIILQCALPWHLQPPIYFRFMVSFSFLSLSPPTKSSIFSYFTVTLIRAWGLSLENLDYHFALVIKVFWVKLLWRAR